MWPYNSSDVGLPAERVYGHPTESGKYVTYGGYMNDRQDGKSLAEMSDDEEEYYDPNYRYLFQRHHKKKSKTKKHHKSKTSKTSKTHKKSKKHHKKAKHSLS